MKKTKSRERFVELAEKRVRRAIKDIRLIGNLSNRSNYSYTDEDVRKIVHTLSTELANMKRRFETRNEPDDIDFKL
ncbi:hypothetical protein D6779_04275 [Candidatus Parcubacteria bacterium]|nr:MAG: hypothetical protein D6779_04275 [Candidatus Parcubacteria bacterium]